MAISFSALVIFWRVIVIAMNDAWAIARDRWTDSSYWLAEDPLFPVERAISRILFPASLNIHVAMYLLELVGVCLWLAVAIASAALILRLHSARPVPLISWRVCIVVWVLAFACAYVGGLWRQTIADSLLAHSDSSLTTLAMMTTVVGSGYVPVSVLAFVSWWDQKRGYAPGRTEQGH
jgi:hypothetical protein